MNYIKEIEIEREIDEVFQKLTSPDFMVKWQESLESYEQNDDGNWVYTDTHTGKPMKITQKVLEKEAPTTYKVEYTTNGVVNIMNNKLEKIDKGRTKWISENEFRFTTLGMKVIGFMFGGSFKKQTERDMNSFKQALQKA